MQFYIFSPVIANKGRVYYGLLKEPDINIPLDDDEDGGEGEGDKPKVKLMSLFIMDAHFVN